MHKYYYEISKLFIKNLLRYSKYFWTYYFYFNLTYFIFSRDSISFINLNMKISIEYNWYEIFSMSDLT